MPNAAQTSKAEETGGWGGGAGGDVAGGGSRSFGGVVPRYVASKAAVGTQRGPTRPRAEQTRGWVGGRQRGSRRDVCAGPCVAPVESLGVAAVSLPSLPTTQIASDDSGGHPAALALPEPRDTLRGAAPSSVLRLAHSPRSYSLLRLHGPPLSFAQGKSGTSNGKDVTCHHHRHIPGGHSSSSSKQHPAQPLL
ncbi:unnamed protein product [Lampetra fluviatilis]